MDPFILKYLFFLSLDQQTFFLTHTHIYIYNRNVNKNFARKSAQCYYSRAGILPKS